MYDKGPPHPPPSKKSNFIKISQYMKKLTFLREGGGERGEGYHKFLS